jgi:hypothetical protein
LMTSATCHDISCNAFMLSSPHLEHFGTNSHIHHVCSDIHTPTT